MNHAILAHAGGRTAKQRANGSVDADAGERPPSGRDAAADDTGNGRGIDPETESETGGGRP